MDMKNKKNRILVMMLVISMLAMALTACGGSGTDSEPAEQDAIETEELETEEAPVVEEPAEEAEDTDSDVISPEFKKTMDDYEAWFDHYCEVMNKYKENPTDLELMSEMTDLMTEETEMLDQMEKMDESEMNTAELAYYIEVTARIEKKLLEVADY